MIVEIPAGSNQKIEFDKKRKKFVNDTIGGNNKLIDFLPYPGNYGYIPGTLKDKEKGGDGDPLDVLILSEALEAGTKIQVKLLAAILTKDRGELDCKLIAIPADEALQTINAKDYVEFSMKYGAAKDILENWFVHYKGLGQVEFLGWRNERFAEQEIEKWETQ